MTTASTKIIVAGDHSLDLVEIPLIGNEGSLSAVGDCGTPGLVGRSRLVTRRGGALLLADFVEYVVGEYVFTHDVGSPEQVPLGRIPRTIVELALFPRATVEGLGPASVYRVKRMRRVVEVEASS